MFAEHALEGGSRSSSLHVEQCAASEEVPTVVVQEGQRIAVDPVASPELALEIDRPIPRSAHRCATAPLPGAATSGVDVGSSPARGVSRCRRRCCGTGGRPPTTAFEAAGEASSRPSRESSSSARARPLSSISAAVRCGDSDEGSAAALLQTGVATGSNRRAHLSPVGRDTPWCSHSLAHRPLARRELSHKPRPFHQRTRLLPWHPRTCKGCARTPVKDLTPAVPDRFPTAQCRDGPR